MFKIIIIIFFFLNLSPKVFAEFKKSDPYTLEIYELYDDCIYEFKKPYKLTINYSLGDYTNLPENFRLSKLKCNLIYKEFINNELSSKKKLDFNKEVNNAILNNEIPEDNIYLKIYLDYHLDIIQLSEDLNEKKKSFIEIEKNYLKKTNIKINEEAAHITGALGWLYNIDKDFFNFKKSFNYLSDAVKYTKNKYNLKYYRNNLGVIYDQNRYGNSSKKKNNKNAFRLYKLAAEDGLHYSYGNIAKFYVLGLGGIKKDYEKAITNYKLARIASYGDDNFSDLAILFQKKRVPNNFSEYIFWLEEYLIKKQDSEVFQQIAWFLDENEKKKTTQLDYIEMYKWQYLCHKLCKNYGDKERALSEMKILSQINLTNLEIEEAMLKAENWKNKYWNKPVQNYEFGINETKDKTLVDMIKGALLRK
jgi:TPR repeat protein